MKFRTTFKCPDAYDNTLNMAWNIENFDKDDEKDMELYHTVENQMSKVFGKFVQWGEMITVEFDTETGTATVLER